MIRMRIPAIREIKGDNEMPATRDNAIAIGQSPEWMVWCFSSEGYLESKARMDSRIDIIPGRSAWPRSIDR
jgi:hypothetical protein